MGAAVSLAAAVMAVALLWCSGALAAGPRVILLRGWFGVFSTGMDNLGDELVAKGIAAEVHGHEYWDTSVADILRERASGKISPIVLIGHSQGANNIISLAQALKPHNVPVDLLITLAPFLQNPVPGNVVRAINYYQVPGWGSPLVPGRDFHGKISNIDLADELTIFHITIDKSSKIHAEIAREIAALPPLREPPKAVATARKPAPGTTGSINKKEAPKRRDANVTPYPSR